MTAVDLEARVTLLEKTLALTLAELNLLLAGRAPRFPVYPPLPQAPKPRGIVATPGI